ncbi:nucleotidyltransferase [Paratissierella segnis]|jgi:predicted nucleotidyltransferase|uniref:tRNA(Met) cytidine acetate ligase n=1 Tax=Paratissierella segnis TaxID=2763679 RepID=A0A926IKK8_9FIRM|nr:nucleotidyltransferase [Paratissierella segnis]MBC8588601.1 nucleotidyltransferase [Paratissierella segnis]
MKVVGFITEYNPFHFGHKFHLEEAKKLTNSTHSIAAMSSSFVQRGEPSLVDKWTKAKIAIENGVDLVIELPFIYSVQSAELFAYGGVNILNSLGIVDYLAFGSETGQIEPLKKIVTVLNKEPIIYKEIFKKYLNLGLSFSEARSLSLSSYFTDNQYNYSELLKQSNNILAIEYMKALERLNSSIQPIAIKRQGNDYKDENITTTIASATAIRKRIQEDGLESIKDYVPNETFLELEGFYNRYNHFNYLENYNEIFQYILRTSTKENMLEIMDMENGLENRVLDKGSLSSDINIIIDSIQTRRYPKTRIQRIFIHLLNDLYGYTIKEIYKKSPSYVRILGSNEKGLELINRIKESSNVPIITKFADSKYIEDIYVKKMLKAEEKATNLFFLGLSPKKPLVNMDFLISPYIKTK